MSTQIVVLPSGLNKVGSSIFNAPAMFDTLRSIYTKPSPRKGEGKLTARIRMAEVDGLITSNEASLLRMKVVNYPKRGILS